MSNLSGFVKRLRDIMRNDAGINGDAQRIEQIAWMLFLKVYDAKEQDWNMEEKEYVSIIPEECSWKSWAVDDHTGTALTGDKLLNFVNNILFPVLKGNDIKDATGKIIIPGVKVDSSTPIKKAIVQTTFADANQYMKDGVLLRQVINVIDDLDLGDYEESHAFGEIYETILKELQSAGIQPDVLVLRTEHELSTTLRKKVALFCNVDENAVVQSIDAPTIYEVPILMQSQGLDVTILKKMGLPVGDTPGLGPWRAFLERRHKAETTEPVHIALVGKYDLQDAYKSIREALSQAGTYNDRKVSVDFVNSEKLTDENVAEALKGMSGVLIGPGFGERGIAGKFVAIKYARTHDIPTFGICLGMQCIAIEFARNVLGYADANSREMDEKTPHNVIDIMEEQKAITNMGGTMRLGAYECVLDQNSKTFEAYKSEHIQERHRHRYEFNNDYKQEFEKAGMKCVGINPESDLVEIVEIPTLKWFIGVQFHPEYSSTVLKPHPLFLSFIKAAINKG